MTPATVDTTNMARAPIIWDPIIPAPPAIQAVAIARAAVMLEAAVTVEEVVTAVAIRAVPANRNGCVVVSVPQLLLDSF